MKNKLTQFVFAAFLFAACQKDEITLTGQVSFELPDRSSNDGRVGESAVPSFILLTIENTQGASIYQDKKISIYAFGEKYISEMLELSTGNYKLTKFIVLNSNSESLFASPMAGAPLANLVSAPLPIEFSISANGTTQIEPEVLPVSSTNDPVQFGYAAFGFKVKKRIQSKVLFEFDTTINDFAIVSKDVYKFDGALLKEITTFDAYNNTNLLLNRKFFEYDQNNRLIMIKFQPIPDGNANYFHVKKFDYGPTETKITMYEMTDSWKSVEYYTTRKNTTSKVQLTDDYRTIDYGISNGNLVSLKLSDRPYPTKMEYDNHVNPEYFIDQLSELSYVNTEIGSKNNLIRSTIIENGVEKIVLNVAIRYDADGYPQTRTYEYASGEKFKYSYTYE